MREGVLRTGAPRRRCAMRAVSCSLRSAAVLAAVLAAATTAAAAGDDVDASASTDVQAGAHGASGGDGVDGSSGTRSESTVSSRDGGAARDGRQDQAGKRQNSATTSTAERGRDDEVGSAARAGAKGAATRGKGITDTVELLRDVLADLSQSAGVSSGAVKEGDGAEHESTPTVRLPLSLANAAAMLVLVVLAITGAVSLYRVGTRQKCACPLCTGDYVVEHKIASGGFGRVFVVRRAVDDKEFVLKQIQVDDINDANEAQVEAKDLRSLHHPRVVKYEEDWIHTTSPHNPGTDPRLFVCIVMEKCEGDLREVIESVRSPDGDDEAGDGGNGDGDAEQRAGELIPEDDVVRYLVELETALRHCHKSGVVHRDIKPQNVFVDENDEVRLGDFGLCRQVHGNDFESATHTEAGTDCYKAPETILGGRRDARKSDQWGVGLLLLELTTLTLAYERDEAVGAVLLQSPAALPNLVKEIPSAYSAVLRRLIARLLHPDPSRRPTADQVLRLKFLRHAVRREQRALKRQRRRGRSSRRSPGRAPGSKRVNAKAPGSAAGHDSADSDGSENEFKYKWDSPGKMSSDSTDDAGADDEADTFDHELVAPSSPEVSALVGRGAGGSSESKGGENVPTLRELLEKGQLGAAGLRGFGGAGAGRGALLGSLARIQGSHRSDDESARRRDRRLSSGWKRVPRRTRRQPR